MGRNLSVAALKKTLYEERALSLRLSGATYADIASALDLDSPTTAKNLIDRCMTRQVKPGTVEKVRLMQNMRIDLALKGVMEKVMRGDLMAVDRMVALEHLRARLFGTYAKVTSKVEVEGEILERHQYENLTDAERLHALGEIFATAQRRLAANGNGTQASEPTGSNMVAISGEVLERS
jgi:hypothetical protein